MNIDTENNDWYDAPKRAPKPLPEWLSLVVRALFYGIFCGFLSATLLAFYNYAFPPPYQTMLETHFEFYALLLNGLIGAVVGLIFGLGPVLLMLLIFNYGIKLPKIWQIGIIGVIAPIVILYGFDLLLKGKMNGLLPVSQYLIAIFAGFVVGLIIFKPDIKPYLAPKPKAE